MKKDSTKKEKRLFPIGLKLSLIIGFLVLISLSMVTIFVSRFVTADVQNSAEENNFNLNTRAASTINDKLSTIRSNTFQLLDLIGIISGNQKAVLIRQAEAFFFERNPDIASIELLSEDGLSKRNASDSELLNSRFFISNEVDESALRDFLSSIQNEISRSCNGETIALNASPFFGIPVMSLLFPWSENGRNQTCIITFSIANLNDSLATGSTNQTFIINDQDELLLHPTVDKILIGESLKNHPLVSEIRKTNQNNDTSRQIPYKESDENGKESECLGSFQKISMCDIIVITTVPMDLVLEGVRDTTKNNIFITAIVLCLTIIIVLFYSRYGISKPIRRLTSATRQIQMGNFDAEEFSKLKDRNDEIGRLNQGTKDEIQFLNTFSQFTNKGVAKAIARKEIDFQPHLKIMTIFFSDIRGFTKISDGIKKFYGPMEKGDKDLSPAKMIEFLNNYMGRMVRCIYPTGGVVDKFEGDAIMAEWGILRNENEAHDTECIKQDAINGLKCAIAMRYSLMEYNKGTEEYTEEFVSKTVEKIKKYKAEHDGQMPSIPQPHIRIGCGLNYGEATAGIMGSEGLKMEYTAIGDPVNFASRTEASNKPCGTDILITQDLYNLLKNDYIRQESNKFTISEKFEKDEIIAEKIPATFEVKGKGKQNFYGIVNMPNFSIEDFFRKEDPSFVPDPDCLKACGPTGPKTMKDVRNMLGIPTPDFDKVDLDASEEKIQVSK